MAPFLKAYWKQCRKGLGIFLLFSLIFLGVFLLYGIPMEAVLYPAILCGLLGVIFLVLDVRRAWRTYRQLEILKTLPASLMEPFPEPDTMEAAEYQEIVQTLREGQKQLESGMALRYEEMVEYYTIWAHQIKTPIASMRLTLQNEDSELSRRLSEDLLRIEQYVEMVLCYLRLDSSSTDYVFQEYDLDSIVKQAVRKFAGQFIRRKIRLDYQPLHTRVVTDEKWLLFVVEQVLSNALKYTPAAGTVTIDLEEPKTLCIRDTGMGIAPEDLPRVFEKGYTGYNGRNDKKASGIGLYLCRRICKNLNHVISVDSSLDSGTVVRIRLEQAKLGKE